MKTPNPKPCPFCGSAAEIKYYTDNWVSCNNNDCRAFGPTGTTKDLAITLWNKAPRRTPRKTKQPK